MSNKTRKQVSSTSKRRIVNKTEIVANCLMYSDDQTSVMLRNVYFKCCLMRDMQPRFGHFCSMMNITHFTQGKWDIYVTDPELNKQLIDQKLRKVFREWKLGCMLPFSMEELIVLEKRRVTENVRRFLDIR